PNPDAGAVMRRLADLAGGRQLLVHLYTAWSWYNPTQLDADVKRYGGAGYGIVLSVKYSPPAGRDDDLAGYEAFARAVVQRYGRQPGVVSFVIGNEANMAGVPDAADGAFTNARPAVVRGVVAARQAALESGSPARVGFNFASTSASADALFLQDLARIG